MPLVATGTATYLQSADALREVVVVGVSDDSKAGHDNDGTKDLIGSGHLKYRYCGESVLLTMLCPIILIISGCLQEHPALN